MALTLLPAAQANLAEASVPSAHAERTADRHQRHDHADVPRCGRNHHRHVGHRGRDHVGVVSITGVNQSTNVVTISGTITTLTASAYVFTLTSDGSLHTATPGTTGASEVTGGTYGRQGTTWGQPSSGVEATTNAQNWTLMPSCTVTYFGVWSAVSSGTYLGGGALTSSLTVPAGATVAAAIGALTTSVQG